MDGNGIVAVFEFNLQPPIAGQYPEKEDVLEEHVCVKQSDSLSSGQVYKSFTHGTTDSLSLPCVLD